MVLLSLQVYARRQHRWAQLCQVAPKATDPRKHPAARTTESAYELSVQAAMAVAAADELQYGKTARTQQAYQTVAHEFRAFTERMPAALADWQRVGPHDVLTFFISAWLPQHSGRDCEEVTPGYLANVLSQLAHVLDLHGREGKWNAERLTGNPVRSSLIREWVKSQHRKAARLGRRECSAVPMRDCKLRAALAAIDEKAATLSGGVALSPASRLQELTLRRDAAFLSIVWDSGRRSHDIANTNWDTLYGSVSGAGRLASLMWQSGEEVSTLFFSPTQIKTCQAGRPSTVVVSASGTLECPVARMRAYWTALLAMRGASAVSGRVFPARCGVASQCPMSTTSANAALRKHLGAAGMLEGETVHGFKRGRVQTGLAAGETEDSVGRHVATSKKTLRRYGDCGRHLR